MTFGQRRPVEAWRVSGEWKRVAAYVKRRDGHRCSVCHVPELFSRSASGKRRMSNLVVGHIVPAERYAGSKYAAENLYLLCRSCNASQSNRTPAEWQAARTGRLVDLGVTAKPDTRNPFERPRPTIFERDPRPRRPPRVW